MWLEEGVLARPEAERRVSEVIFAMVDSDEKVQGVTTSYHSRVPGVDRPVWFLRMFIRKSVRGALGLKNRSAIQWEMFDKTCAHLAQTTRETHQGVVMVTENRKLWSKHWQRRLAEKGWRVTGNDPKGSVVYFLAFSA
jgi:hypothetical protein